MKILIISAAGYPTLNDPYSGGFVHTRVAAYIEKGHDCAVFVPANMTTSPEREYSYQGIRVSVGGLDDLKSLERSFSPEIVVVHFTHPVVYKYLSERNTRTPIVFWVHGYGAIGWFRYFFEFKFRKEYLIDLYVSNRNLVQFHFLAKNHEHRNIHFVFVSEWMRKTASLDTLSTFRQYKVIPNPIDENVFSYIPKRAEDRKRILLVRSFANKKYANDIAVKAILDLSNKPFFNELQFAIYGRGKYLRPLTDPLQRFSNITINDTFLPQHEIAKIHKQYGLFLCPTRMDAQGVSMCEAMMSGLIPLTSNSTAIPEFVTDGIDGFLTRNHSELAQRIEYLYFHPDVFMKMSADTHASIVKRSGSKTMIIQELNYLQSLIGAQ